MNTNEFARILLTWIKSFLSWIGIPRDRLNELDEIIFLILIVVIAFAVGAVFHYLSVRFTRKVLKYKNISFQTNLLSGTYPNTSNLIPDEFAMNVKINKNDFMASVDRAALLTQGKDKNIIKMKIENEEMIINSYASEIGKVEEKLKIKIDNNSNIDISFSSKYMLR